MSFRAERWACVLAFLSTAALVSSCGSSLPGRASLSRDGGATTSLPSDSPTTSPTTATTTPGPVPTPDETTTIVNWGNYHPSYNTVAQLYTDSGYVFIATVRPFIHYPTADALFAPFDTLTITDLAAPATLPRSVLGIPQGRPGDVPVAVGHTYLAFYGTDFTDDTTCIVGGQRGLFDYDAVTQTLMRTDSNPASTIPKILTLARMTTEVQSAVASAPQDVGSASNPAKWPPPPVCALSAITG